MRTFVLGTYLNIRIFAALGAIVILFTLSFPLPVLFPFAQASIALLVAAAGLDALLLYNRKINFQCDRQLPNVMSLGNDHLIHTTLINDSDFKFAISVVNELPTQFQVRNRETFTMIAPRSSYTLKEKLRPTSRGEYHFGSVHVFLRTRLRFLERRITFKVGEMVPVYPSVMDVKKYELRASRKLSNYLGVKKIRRIGQSYEFEQISEYTVGDNYQTMNWKATGKTNKLMVNRYTDEKAQPVYCFIDKSRYMRMPFNGLSLLDYAINASLIISNTALKRQDKAGIVTFSDKQETFLKAENHRNQIQRILQRLYREGETKIEANYELMYSMVRKQINGRSLIFLFSNFDTFHALERVLPILRKMNKMHLLVVVVFENTELEDYHQQPATTVLDIYNHTIARKLTVEKKQVLAHLRQFGIQVIYTPPESLSINTLNKYLELKSRGMI